MGSPNPSLSTVPKTRRRQIDGGGHRGPIQRVALGEEGIWFAGVAPRRSRGQSTPFRHTWVGWEIERKTSWGLESVWKRPLVILCAGAGGWGVDPADIFIHSIWGEPHLTM